VLREIHVGIYGSHAGGQSSALKALRQRFYWLTMDQDGIRVARKCEGCQKNANIYHQPAEQLTTLSSPWPFTQ